MTKCDHCQFPVDIKQAGCSDQKKGLCASCSKLQNSNMEIHITPMRRNELELVYAWRSNPHVYCYFQEQDGPLQWEEHIEWYETRDPDRHDFIIHYAGRKVGIINIDPEKSVGVYIGEVSARGQGVATAALNWLCNRFAEQVPLFAEVHQENDASKRLFEQCGFRKNERDGKWIQYKYES